MREFKTIVLVLIACGIGFLAGLYVGKTRGIPFVKKSGEWAVGLYVGDSPTSPRPAPGISNPVLTRRDVTDVTASFVADPFLLPRDGRWYLFVEVLNAETDKGEIGVAVSDDCREWMWKGIVLAEPYHLSYPHVFEWEGEVYMVPESHRAHAVSLYRATDFPAGWTLVATLLHGDYSDPTVFRHEDAWWMLTSSTEGILHLFTSDRLDTGWREHPASPVVAGNFHKARPAGAVVNADGTLFRFAQDDFPAYGSKVRAFQITQLDATRFSEREIAGGPVLKASGSGWNAYGMHHLDAWQRPDGSWLMAADGFSEQPSVGLAY